MAKYKYTNCRVNFPVNQSFDTLEAKSNYAIEEAKSSKWHTYENEDWYIKEENDDYAIVCRKIRSDANIKSSKSIGTEIEKIMDNFFLERYNELEQKGMLPYQQDSWDQQDDLKEKSKIIALHVRNEMEDFHCSHLTNSQMAELNPIIRNAIYNVLILMREYYRHPFSDMYNKVFDLYRACMPDYWEEPELDEDTKHFMDEAKKTTKSKDK
jgi:hypothetical protein